MLKKKLGSAKKFVSDHRIAIAVVTTTTVCYVIHRKAVENWNEFAAEHDLLEEFYQFNTER